MDCRRSIKGAPAKIQRKQGAKVAQSVTTAPATYAALGIDPEVEEIVGFVWAGIAAKVPPKPERPPLDELVRRMP